MDALCGQKGLEVCHCSMQQGQTVVLHRSIADMLIPMKSIAPHLRLAPQSYSMIVHL